MQNQLLMVVLAALLTMSATAAAQHVDVLVWDDSGKVGVGLYDFDNEAAIETRVREA